MIIQLDPPIPLHVLGRGNGKAILAIDYGPDYDLIFTIVDDKTGEIWCESNRNVRGVINHTLGREAT